MAGEQLEIDPLAEGAANIPLSLVDNASLFLLEHDYPAPEKDMQYATSTDTEGELPVAAHYKNRQIMVKLHVLGANDAARDQLVGFIQQKVAKIDREGGTLKRRTAAGLTIVFDLIAAKVDVVSDKRYTNGSRAVVTIVFEARPFGRGVVGTTATTSESTLPVLQFTVPSIPGDVPALGKLVINELQGVDQWWVSWGLQSRFYSSAASAALFWQAEALTAKGTAAAAAGPTGASGAGSNTLLEGSLTATFAAILSTQATGGGAHMSHVGDFRVFARVQRPTTNTGVVSLALEWGEGDFRRRTTNGALSYAANEREGVWTIADLGQVHLTAAVQGTQRWEGRIIAKSTVAGDDVYVDCLWLIPITEGSGVVAGVQQFENPTSFSARDEFDQTAGALTAKVLPVGGTWAGAGDASDFSVETSGHTAQRTATSDAALETGRYAIAGSTNYTNLAVQIDGKLGPGNTGAPFLRGAMARYVDVNNWIIGGAYSYDTIGLYEWRVYKRVAGVLSVLASTPRSAGGQSWITMRLVVDANGRWWLYGFLQRAVGAGSPVLSGNDADLATGGALATGKPGFYDAFTDSGAFTRNYDSFMAFVPSADAAVFASQSLEVRHDRVIREDAGGTIWSPPSKYEGDYLTVPAAGREGRTARLIVKACRNDPETMADASIDDISASLTYTPRYLVLPE